jgi:hypothetical protein
MPPRADATSVEPATTAAAAASTIAILRTMICPPSVASRIKHSLPFLPAGVQAIRHLAAARIATTTPLVAAIDKEKPGFK